MPSDRNRAVTGPLDMKIMVTVGMLVLAYQLLTLGGHHYSIDGALTFQAARVLLTDHTLFFDPPIRWGRSYYETSKYGLGMTVAYLPLLAIVGLFRPELLHQQFDSRIRFDWNLMQNDLYLYCSVLNPIIVAITGVLLFRLALRTGLSRGWAVVASLVACLASPYSVYARFDFSQPFVGLILVWSILRIYKAAENSRLLNWLYAGLMIAFGISVRVDFIVFVPWLILLGYWMKRSNNPDAPIWNFKDLFVMCLPMILGGVVILIFNYQKFGSLFDFGEGIHAALPFPIRLIGLLVSPGRGFLVYFPLACLLISGLLVFAKKRRWEAIFFAGVFITQLVFYTLWFGWHGGWCWGPRFLIPIVPLVALFCIHSAAHSYNNPARRTLFACLAGLSWFFTLNGICFDFVPFYGQFYDRWRFDDSGLEHFLLKGSPIINGWRFSPSVANYDLFFLEQIFEKNVVATILFFCFLMLLIVCAIRLRNLIKYTKP